MNRLRLVVVAFCFGPACVSGALADEAQERRTLLGAFETLQAETQELAMSHVRTLAIACELYASIHDSYPAGPFGSVDQLTSTCVPEFLPEPILEGPWGEPIYYWSNGSDYLLVAAGKDHEFDRDYAAILEDLATQGWDEFRRKVCAGARGDLDADLVWLSGEFCAWFRRDDT